MCICFMQIMDMCISRCIYFVQIMDMCMSRFADGGLICIDSSYYVSISIECILGMAPI